ncbi:MAG: hypothetical protein HYY00_07980 [Chloroflexi bacterium]|nr:hypothetical protein [Chloroflexota bacterium]
MKDKLLIYQGDPCTMRLDDPKIQTLPDVKEHGAELCPYHTDRRQCSLPRYGCVRVAGLKVARYLLLFYGEASQRTLALEVEEFRQRAPLPPRQLEAYVDTPNYHLRQVTDPQLVVQRVSEYASAVLDLKPGERVFRASDEGTPPLKEPGAELTSVEGAGSTTEPSKVAS